MVLFKEFAERASAYAHGRIDRQNGRNLSDSPYLDRELLGFWQEGWFDADFDMEMEAAAERERIPTLNWYQHGF